MIELQTLSKSNAKDGEKDNVIMSQVIDKQYTYMIKKISLLQNDLNS